MKKLFILSLAALGMVACEKKSEHIIISGKIISYDGSQFRLVGADVDEPLKINEDGTFADTLTKPSYYTLFSQRGFFVPLYLKQGDVLAIEIDPAKISTGVKLSGNDTIASAYLQEKLKLTNELQQGFEAMFRKAPAEFKAELDKVTDRYATFLKNYKGLPSDFVALEEKGNKYFNLHFKSIYPRIHQNLSESPVELPTDFDAEIAAIDFDNGTDFELYNEYQQLVINNFYGKLSPDNSNWNELIDYIGSLKSANIQKQLAEALPQGLSAANTAEVNQKIVTALKKFSKKEDLIKEAEEKLVNFEKIKPGVPAPGFEFETVNGKKVSLESLKGNVVYVDVWATWCVPCIQEIPALEALEKEYHGKKVAFVSISIDRNKADWHKFQTEKKPTGIQLHADLKADDSFDKAYQIETIPRFILIDKEGNIINADAPRPSESTIKDLINKHL